MSDSAARGPLPQWEQPHGVGTALYEADDPQGRRWRLWSDETPTGDGPFSPTWCLAPVDDLGSVEHVTGEHGLYFALDTAGMRIARDAVRANPERARRQLGLIDQDLGEAR